MSAFKNRSAFEVVSRAKALLGSGKSFVRRVVSGKRNRQPVSAKNMMVTAPGRELTGTRGVAHLLGTSKQSSPIFFIVGYQKSGTTWLMKMLNSHPEILCQGEGRPFGRDFRQEHLKEVRRSYPPASLYNAIVTSEDLRY